MGRCDDVISALGLSRPILCLVKLVAVLGRSLEDEDKLGQALERVLSLPSVVNIQHMDQHLTDDETNTILQDARFCWWHYPEFTSMECRNNMKDTDSNNNNMTHNQPCELDTV